MAFVTISWGKVDIIADPRLEFQKSRTARRREAFLQMNGADAVTYQHQFCASECRAFGGFDDHVIACGAGGRKQASARSAQAA